MDLPHSTEIQVLSGLVTPHSGPAAPSSGPAAPSSGCAALHRDAGFEWTYCAFHLVCLLHRLVDFLHRPVYLTVDLLHFTETQVLDGPAASHRGPAALSSRLPAPSSLPYSERAEPHSGPAALHRDTGLGWTCCLSQGTCCTV